MKETMPGRKRKLNFSGVLLFSLNSFLRLFCLAVVFLGCYSLADTISLYQDAGSSSWLRFRPSPQKSADPVIECLDGSVGWLNLAEAGLEAPVMQGSDNTEYLNKNPAGEFSLSGSLFLDARNKPDFSDSYSLIYGHHMEHWLMFGALDHYLDENFFMAHPEASLTVNGTEYRLEIFAVLECSAYEEIVFNPPESTQLLNWIHAHARYQRQVTDSGRILGMSTCQYPDTQTRTVVFAMIREKESVDDENTVDKRDSLPEQPAVMPVIV